MSSLNVRDLLDVSHTPLFCLLLTNLFLQRIISVIEVHCGEILQ